MLSFGNIGLPSHLHSIFIFNRVLILASFALNELFGGDYSLELGLSLEGVPLREKGFFLLIFLGEAGILPSLWLDRN